MFEAPRGTHDVLPSEQPAWRRVIGAAEEVCRLYGYRPISTPVFEDTEVFARTSGAGSDVVQKEMYTFEDRGGRSLTLRPEATAPIVRAYLEHGMHREPQPVKLYTVGPMYRYSAPQRGRYREHWQLSVEAIGTDDPAIDAELIALYADLLARLGVTRYELQLNSIGDRECRPAYLERLESWLDEHEARARRRRASQAGDVSSAGVRHEERAAREPARRGAADRRLALRRLPGRTSRRFAAISTRSASPTASCRRSFAASTTTRGRRSSSSTRRSAPSRRSAAAGGTTISPKSWEASTRRGSASARASSGSCSASVTLHVEDDAGIDVFFVVEEGADRAATLAAMMELRRAGLACDADYAGRSRKGQLTQASRLAAREVVVVDAETDLAAVVERLRP